VPTCGDKQFINPNVRFRPGHRETKNEKKHHKTHCQASKMKAITTYGSNIRRKHAIW
jgi:hypothetical protein